MSSLDVNPADCCGKAVKLAGCVFGEVRDPDSTETVDLTVGKGHRNTEETNRKVLKKIGKNFLNNLLCGDASIVDMKEVFRNSDRIPAISVMAVGAVSDSSDNSCRYFK